jgi:type II secretory pathway predicted ATPase ExeA
MTITSPTAGQRQALADLGDAVRARRPLILLFGETGAGKTSVVDAVLDAPGNDVIAAGVSATGSAFVASPGFDALLSAICAGLKLPAASEQGPAALAGLGALIRANAEAGKAVVVAIDHADRLGDGVIADLLRLHEALGVQAEALVRIFAGTAALAPRIEASLRQTGSDERLTEIRLSAPTADEVATILAHADAARPGGPVLTPEAIAAISAYARADLHLAGPMADAVRGLAEEQGAGEVTAGLVHETLQGLWAPEPAPAGANAGAGLHDAAAQAIFAPAPAAGFGGTGLPFWLGRARAKLANRNKTLLALSVAGSSLLLAGLVAFALVDREGEPARHAAEEGQPPPSDQAAAPAAPAELPVAPTAAAPAGAALDAEPEAGAPPVVETPPVPVPAGSVAPEPRKDGEIAARPKKPRAPKPVAKPQDASKRWVQTR